MNYFAQFENPGEIDHYDHRNDPRGIWEEDVNLPDSRGLQIRTEDLEKFKENLD